MTTTNPTHDAIRLRGIRQNNLKNIDLDIPIGQLTVVTGLSGAGKSSLVFETLHAEGQRRYVETFSPYTRQFLEMMDRPDVDSIENIRPSIAIQQRNTVKTSRSTVGTMTELCDYFKVWFSHVATLHDPATGEAIHDDTPESIWKACRKAQPGATVVVTFPLEKPSKITWEAALEQISGQGFSRIHIADTRPMTRETMITLGNRALDAVASQLADEKVTAIEVIVDRIKLESRQQKRFVEAATTALRFGQGKLFVTPLDGEAPSQAYTSGLNSPVTGKTFEPAQPALFSFNSPLGACPKCRGFGRVIEIDERLVIPDDTLSLNAGAIKAFQGDVYRECLRDLQRLAPKHDIPLDTPWRDMTESQREWVYEGEPGYVEKSDEWQRQWYGVRRFFAWLESQVYKMHVRVFLSRFRAYTTCPDCKGKRLQPESLNWKWRGHTLPDLYQMPISELAKWLKPRAKKNPRHATDADQRQLELAFEQITHRLQYLCEVGLDYLTLDRSSRTLSGGEVQRINLTTCLGASLTDALFVLDEPSVGLHARDINRLIRVLHRLRDAGNTVVVVEHDEAIMRAADQLLEIGPEPGSRGGQVVFQGDLQAALKGTEPLTLNQRYLQGKAGIPVTEAKRAVIPTDTPALAIKQASIHNLRNLDIRVPKQRLVCLTGVSGSGKSTLMDNVIHQILLERRRQVVDAPARFQNVSGDDFAEVLQVDQSRVSRTPRSNPALYVDVWDDIRNLLAQTEAARSAGMTAAYFSFNAGQGRCDHCQGLGHERIEMQFLADVYVTCPVCDGKRFKDSVLAVQLRGKSVADLLEMDIESAREFFQDKPKIAHKLAMLEAVGLGYLKLGQPLNTLSGGESQRLKLVKYLHKAEASDQGSLLLLDEPTTGLHRHDIKRLVAVMQTLVTAGHSLLVIEHQADVIQHADWVIEMGPEAGSKGGEIVFEGTPEALLKANTHTAKCLKGEARHQKLDTKLAAPNGYGNKPKAVESLEVIGAREHNLRNLSLSLPHKAFTVVTGVSGSGKSSLAFDIIFAEGQRRFMESMSAYARQFVEQLPRAQVDDLRGIAPTVAIEQRVTRGSRKSTVATVTEVAQYLRLLFARIGVQHSPATGEPVVSMSASALRKRFLAILSEAPKRGTIYLCAPLIRGRKGHHQPLADWASAHSVPYLRCDGQLVPTTDFTKLDRYREHDIEAAFPVTADAESLLDVCLKLGKGVCFVLHETKGALGRLSTTNADPITGEIYPTLDPKHFSWNSARGWCPTCHGYGQLFDWMRDDEAFGHLKHTFNDGDTCPDCGGARLNAISRNVRIPVNRKAPIQGSVDGSLSLPELLATHSSKLLQCLKHLKLDRRSRAIFAEILPEIEERLRFMAQVGLDYLPMDRASATLSGGEAQRIRLAAQLGTNLAGVLYVLDEPSIGLHARDNAALIASLHRLRDKGNTLVVVEHDEETMRAADHILDLGPGAGINGGHLLAQGNYERVTAQADSVTGRYLREGMRHPLRGHWRDLPPAWEHKKRATHANWTVLREPSLRNLKGGELHIPRGRLTMVCGVSGAGKSTLLRDLFQPALREAIRRGATRITGKQAALPFLDLRGAANYRQVIEVDQEPIGKTPRSTPATYIGAFDKIRELYATLPEARMYGYQAGYFSFNTSGGRCEVCKGAGRIKMEMQFLPDVYVPCTECNGRRYSAQTESIQWNGKSIADVLLMSFAEAAEFFSFHSQLQAMFQLMVDTGLGYLQLGQSSPTLSGGEAQRLKLVSELSKGLMTAKERSRGITGKPNCYLLEEPTIGLHMSDCERLVELLHRLVDQGHTVVVIEHNLDLIAEADWLVEIGPEGGDKGGELLYQGEVTGLMRCRKSRTAKYLKPLLGI